MKNYFSIRLLIAISIFTLSNSLILHQNLSPYDLTQGQKHNAYQLISHKFQKLMHLETKTKPNLSGPSGDFFMWILSDKDILSSMMNKKPLSNESQNKIKSYLKEHPQVIDTFIESQGKGHNDMGKCLTKMNKQQKLKLYGWVLEQIDLKNIFLDNNQIPALTDEKTNKIAQKALSDPEIGPIFVQCTATTTPNPQK